MLPLHGLSGSLADMTAPGLSSVAFRITNTLTVKYPAADPKTAPEKLTEAELLERIYNWDDEDIDSPNKIEWSELFQHVLEMAEAVGSLTALSEPLAGVARTVQQLHELFKRVSALRSDIGMAIMLVANILSALRREQLRIEAGEVDRLWALMEHNTCEQIHALDRHCRSLYGFLLFLEEQRWGTLQAGPDTKRDLIQRRVEQLKVMYEFTRDGKALNANEATLRILRHLSPQQFSDLADAEAGRSVELADKSRAKAVAREIEENSGLSLEQWLEWTENHLGVIEADLVILSQGRGSLQLSPEGRDAMALWCMVVDGQYGAPAADVLQYMHGRRGWLQSDRRFLRALLEIRNDDSVQEPGDKERSQPSDESRRSKESADTATSDKDSTSGLPVTPPATISHPLLPVIG